MAPHFRLYCLCSTTASGGTIMVSREKGRTVLSVDGEATADELHAALQSGARMWESRPTLRLRARVAQALRWLASKFDPRAPKRDSGDDDSAAAADFMPRKPRPPLGGVESIYQAVQTAGTVTALDTAKALVAAAGFEEFGRPIALTKQDDGGARLDVGDASLQLTATEHRALRAAVVAGPAVWHFRTKEEISREIGLAAADRPNSAGEGTAR